MVWLAPSYLEHKATIQEGVMRFMPHFNSLERVGTVRNTIPDDLERYGLFKKSRARVAKHDDQSTQQERERTNVDQSCHQRDNATAFGARH